MTTDSIAARMATALGAPELSLLKSVALAEGTTRAEAARRGWVDLHFPHASEGIARVTSLHLRGEPPTGVELLSAH